VHDLVVNHLVGVSLVTLKPVLDDVYKPSFHLWRQTNLGARVRICWRERHNVAIEVLL
jgi:hypothetical protein